VPAEEQLHDSGKSISLELAKMPQHGTNSLETPQNPPTSANILPSHSLQMSPILEAAKKDSPTKR
jgi:hypothetical protein